MHLVQMAAGHLPLMVLPDPMDSELSGGIIYHLTQGSLKIPPERQEMECDVWNTLLYLLLWRSEPGLSGR